MHNFKWRDFGSPYNYPTQILCGGDTHPKICGFLLGLPLT